MFYTESSMRHTTLTIEDLNKSLDELKQHDISMFKAMALSSLDIFPDAKLPEGYWCIHCSPDVYLKIQIEIDKMNEEENNGYRKD